MHSGKDLLVDSVNVPLRYVHLFFVCLQRFSALFNTSWKRTCRKDDRILTNFATTIICLAKIIDGVLCSNQKQILETKAKLIDANKGIEEKIVFLDSFL